MEETKNAVNALSGEISIDEAMEKVMGSSEPTQSAVESTQAEPEVKEGDTAPTDKTEESPDEVTEGEEVSKVKDPVRERLARQRDAERVKNAELTGKVEQFQKMMTEWQSQLNRPEIVKARMKDEGYTEEAINAKLRSMGVDVPDSKPDVFQLLRSKMGINVDTLDANNRGVIEDVGRIVDLLIDDRMSRVLPGQIAPIEKQLTEISRKTEARELIKSMRDTVTEEGILDFEKDITPEIGKYISANPSATQTDLAHEFDRINHRLAMERLKLKDKKDVRDGKKEVLKDKQVEGAAPKPTKFSWDGKKAVGDNVDELLNQFGIR